MQKRLLLILTIAFAYSVNAQTLDTVSTGPSYANQVWYNLQSGNEVSANGSSWDFAFQISGFSGAILANTAYGAELYIYPNGDTGAWATVDTLGMSNWTPWHSPSTNWDQGAFNMGIDTSNAFDLGWGKYNFITHHVVGDSLFIWKTASGSIKKVWIESLISGVYTFKVADINGNNLQVKTLAKNQFIGKNFGYYSIAQDSIMDIEPLSSTWDLLFSKYIEDVGIPYSVSGIRTNVGIEAVQVYPVNDPATYNNAKGQTYSSETNIIGHDWKEFSFGCFCYIIEDSTVYFVKTDSATYWKLVMKDFGGSSNGNYIFEKTNVSLSTGLGDRQPEVGAFSVYPNPSVNRNISVIADLPQSIKTAELNILNTNGQLLRKETIQINNSFDVLNIQLNEFQAGIYLIQINHANGSMIRKLILE